MILRYQERRLAAPSRETFSISLCIEAIIISTFANYIRTSIGGDKQPANLRPISVGTANTSNCLHGSWKPNDGFLMIGLDRETSVFGLTPRLTQ